VPDAPVPGVPVAGVPVPGAQPPVTGAGRPAPAPAPGTGDLRVDEAVARLAELAGRPVAEHPEIFGYVHDRLAEALGDLETTGQSGRGDQDRRPGGPGR
jgi:hypothetical protein